MSTPIWTPSPERVASANLTDFHRRLKARFGFGGEDYASLHRWSVEHLEDFWEAAWEDTGVNTSAKHTAVLTDRTMPRVRQLPEEVWFPGARFNFAQHLLRFRDDRTALIAEGEGTPRRRMTYHELYDQVARCAAGLKALGVGEGDRVAAFMPNTIETVVAMLAATSMGAIWSSTSPDFGFQGVMDRFGQIDPKVLLCANGYHYNGKAHDSLEKVAHLQREIGSIEQVVVVPFVAELPSELDGGMSWEALLAKGSTGNGGGAGSSAGTTAPPLEFGQFPFDQPLYIMYSSGTTGAPKCIVHGAGGTLVKHHLEQRYHSDLKREDTLFYFTTCGWMMWNWLVSGLAQGATLVLYDGSPGYPDASRLFRLAEETGITIFGTSPKFLATCQKAGLVPAEQHDLSWMRTMLSTGAPLETNQFHWVYEAIRQDMQLASISGGTDIMGCFMGGNPYVPVYAGEIQGPCLGVDMAAFDETGRPVTGSKGELVCRQPFPSMPIGFWQDPQGQKFADAYFDTYPGIWRHGDFILINEHGGIVVYGRSDATLNPGGVRIGTAEIYRIVEDLPFVLDSIVVGHPVDGEVQVVLFVVMRPGETLTPEREQEIRAAIRGKATPRHVPAVIRPISEVPVTINGKKVELAVGNLLRGEPVKNRDALANPQALDQFSPTTLG
jgi:acetoacetyl-CoA synthetase